MRRAGGLAAFVALLLLWGAGPAAAQGVGERIESFDVVIELRPDGSMAVQETIAYDFGTNRRHGIFRYVPVRFRHDDRYDRVYPMRDIRVEASEATPDEIDISESGANKVMRIGDPDVEISGRHTYVISYVIDGALNSFEDHDELYWNVTGNDWSVPIDATTTSVSTPAAITRVACYAGPTGVNIPCATGGADGRRGIFSHGTLGPSSGMTIVVAVPKGVFSKTGPILDERWAVQRAFSLNGRTLGLSGLVVALGLGGIGRLLWTRGRDRRDALTPVGEGPVEYRPPDDLRPAQIGVLLDERANPLDVTATIVDLAVRGYLTIEELPRSGLFRKRDWKLIRTGKDDADLLVYERTLRNALFSDGDEVTLSDLKNEFADDLRKVQQHLYTDCVRCGFFGSRPDSVRNRWVALGVVAVVLGIGLTVLLAAFTTFGVVGVAVVLVGTVLLVAHRWMPARTAKGAATAARARGFRRFIATAKAEEMQFAEDQQRFVSYLPYAIVFGATKQWAKVFAQLGAGATGPGTSAYPGWYSSPHAFDARGFGDSMDSFTVRTSGTIVSTPSSSGSSGFSGGSSGGGGGGGGGGSW